MARYRFDDIAYNITDKRMPTPDDRELYIGLEHLDTRCLRVSRWGSAVDITGQKLVMRKGDLLFGRRNTYLRRAAIAPHDGLFSAHGMIFRPKTDVITEEFFPYFIVSNYFMDAAIRISVGSLSPTVNWKQLKELEFDIPDIDKQHKYAELFAAVDRTKESYRQLILSTDELVKSQFIEMFGDPIDKPMGWPRMPFSETCSLVTGNTPPRANKAYYGDYLEWIKSDNISTSSMHLTHAAECLSKEGAEVGRIVHAGAILMTCIAGSLNTIGNIALADRDVAFNQQINAFIPTQYEPLFLYYLLMLIRPQLHEAASSALKCILNKGNLERMIAILPDRAAQWRFSSIAAHADKSKFVACQATTYTQSMIQ